MLHSPRQRCINTATQHGNATITTTMLCQHDNTGWQRYNHHNNAVLTQQHSMATLQSPRQCCVNTATQHGNNTITTATLQSPRQRCVNTATQLGNATITMAMLQTAWNRNAAIPHQHCNHNDIIVNVFKEMLRLQFKIKFYGSHTYNYYTWLRRRGDMTTRKYWDDLRNNWVVEGQLTLGLIGSLKVSWPEDESGRWSSRWGEVKASWWWRQRCRHARQRSSSRQPTLPRPHGSSDASQYTWSSCSCWTEGPWTTGTPETATRWHQWWCRTQLCSRWMWWMHYVIVIAKI